MSGILDSIQLAVDDIRTRFLNGPVQTGQELIRLINEKVPGFSASVPQGKAAIFYGGNGTGAAAKSLAGQGSSASWIENTDVGQFLKSESLEALLRTAFNRDESAITQAMAFNTGSPWENNYGDSNRI
jgi:hypothetical protein